MKTTREIIKNQLEVLNGNLEQVSIYLAENGQDAVTYDAEKYEQAAKTYDSIMNQICKLTQMSKELDINEMNVEKDRELNRELISKELRISEEANRQSKITNGVAALGHVASLADTGVKAALGSTLIRKETVGDMVISTESGRDFTRRLF